MDSHWLQWALDLLYKASQLQKLLESKENMLWRNGGLVVEVLAWFQETWIQSSSALPFLTLCKSFHFSAHQLPFPKSRYVTEWAQVWRNLGMSETGDKRMETLTSTISAGVTLPLPLYGPNTVCYPHNRVEKWASNQYPCLFQARWAHLEAMTTAFIDISLPSWPDAEMHGWRSMELSAG